MSPNKLPENDQDLLLARRLGRFIHKDEDIAKIDDMVISDLLVYRQGHKAYEMSIPADGESTWARIEKEIAPVSAKINYLLNKRVWLAAASILIALIFTIFIIQPSKPELLAETGNQLDMIELQDGSEVTLRPHSSLHQLQFSNNEQKYKLSGEGYFTVAPNKDRIFTVESEFGRVEVLGTNFVMRDWGGTTRVFLEKGSVRFENSDRSQAVLIEPGQYSYINSEGMLFEPDSADINEFIDWTRNELIFTNRPASYIFSELEHQFQISIEAPDVIMNDTLGGAISLRERDQSLKDLGDVLNGKFVTENDKDFIFIPN